MTSAGESGTGAGPDLTGAPVSDLRGRIMPASNATFLGEAEGRQVVYKPVAGEKPLWDFPDGTLAGREVSAYALSEVLGWDVVPPTWLGEGPHGLGMVQEWQDVDPDQEAVTLVHGGRVPDGYLAVLEALDDRDQDVTLIHEDTAALRRMAVFDVVANNADRKGGHVLEIAGGHRYGVDHGLTFHHEHKLRTVLWGWHGEPLSDEELDGVQRILDALGGPFADRLAEHLTGLEVDVLGRRCRRLLSHGVLPGPRGQSWQAIPWPPF